MKNPLSNHQGIKEAMVESLKIFVGKVMPANDGICIGPRKWMRASVRKKQSAIPIPEMIEIKEVTRKIIAPRGDEYKG